MRFFVPKPSICLLRNCSILICVNGKYTQNIVIFQLSGDCCGTGSAIEYSTVRSVSHSDIDSLVGTELHFPLLGQAYFSATPVAIRE